MTYGHEWVRYMDIHVEENAQRRELRITVDRHQPGDVVQRRDMAITDDAIEHMDQVEALVVALRLAQVAVKSAKDEVRRQDAQIARYRQSDRDWRWDNWIRAWAMIGLQRRIDGAGLAEDPEQSDEICSGCLSPIDTSTCQCGAAADEHYGEHSPVPMGCICHHIPHVYEATDYSDAIGYWKDRCAHAEALASGREWIEPPPLRGEQEDPF